MLFIFLIICPVSENEKILDYLNSLKTEEEIYLSIKHCPILFLIKEGISRLNNEEYLEEILNTGDWYIKYLVIPKIKNENLLKEIYLNEKDKLLKEEAIKYIKDQNFLETAAKTDKNPFALVNIENEEFLKQLVVECEKEEIGEKALFFIENQKILLELLKILKNENLKEIIFLKLKNSPYIKEIFTGEFPERVKINALSYATEEILKELIEEENFPYKKEALLNIRDQDFLKKFFTSSMDNSLKIAALENIGDEEFLKNIFHKMPEFKVYALKKIQDENFLKGIYPSLNSILKVEVISKIKDQNFLKKEFMETKDQKIKNEAIKRIFDRDFLKKVYFKTGPPEQKRAVLYNLKREDQDFYKKVVLVEKNKCLKAEALKFIEDENFLKNVILGESSIYVKIEGLKRISNQSVLKEIYAKEDAWFLKYFTLKKIKDENFLKKLKDNETEELFKNDTLEGPISYEDICVNLKEDYFKDLKKLKEILKDLGMGFNLNYRSKCKERRYFFEEGNLYPPDRGKVFQVKLTLEISNNNENYYKKIEYLGRHLAKRENFERNFGKIDGYFVKYYIPEIDLLEFTMELMKEYDFNKLKNYENSKNKYIQAAALILKSRLEAKCKN